MEFLLGEVGQILVICAGISLILITAICVICSVAPSCWIYRCLHKDEPSPLLKSEEARRQALHGAEVVLAEFPHLRPISLHEPRSQLKLVNPGPYRQTWHHSGLYSEQLPECKRPELRASGSSFASSAYHSQSSGSNRSSATISVRDSTHSSISETSERGSVEDNADARSTTSDNQHVARRSDGGEDPYVAPPQVSLNLQVSPSGADTEAIRLYVTVNFASYLPLRQYGGAADAFLQMRLIRPPPGATAAPLMEVRTRTVRRSSLPQFNETFQIDMRRADLKELSLEVTAYDQDRYANPSELSQGSLALANMFDLLTSMTSQHVNLSMQMSNKVLGEVMVSVTYLPTAQRVSLSCTKARNLCMEGQINPYIRVFLLSSLGRSVKRKKTTFKVNSANPSFNETLSFDVASNQLEALTFLLTVWHKTDVHGSSSDESSSESRGVSKDVCIGKVCLGNHVRGTAQKLHWRSVLLNPRKVVTHWHALH